ncbi:MAG: GNAT family protein [Candidatus Thermoplasmatota archaeon]
MSAPTLEGERVRLRLPTERDLAFAMRFANDEELRGWLRFYRPTGEAEEMGWLRSLGEGQDVVWLMERKDDHEPLGFISLSSIDHVNGHAELGLGILSTAHRGGGAGGEACRLVLSHAYSTLRLQRVLLFVLADNPALRLYQRLGFRVEGTLRRHAFKRGAWRDQHVMGLLAEEWSQ